MSSRRRSRQRALQILFLWDARRQPVEDAIAAYYDTLFPTNIPSATSSSPAWCTAPWKTWPTWTRSITRHAEHWRMERMPAVDRNILRLAVYEMTWCGTPAAVAIDEALELARKFSGEESVQFVNGVLDAVYRELPSPAKGASPPA